MTSETDEINRLLQSLKEKDEELSKAGQYGKSLLERNSHLEEILNQTHTDYEKKIEDLEQEKYSLELKLEALRNSEIRTESSFIEEKQAMKRDHAKQIGLLDKSQKSELNSIKLKLSELQRDLDENVLLGNQQKETITKQQNIIAEMNSANMKRLKNESLSPELAELTTDNERLQIDLQTAKEENEEMNHYIEQLSFQMKQLEKTSETLREGKDCAMEESRSYYEALEQSRHDNRELTRELQDIRSQPQDPNSRGNSLFAEVEDKRIQAEKRLISLQVKVKCTERRYTQQVNYSMQLKTQIAQLLQTGGNDADRDQLQRLERALLNSRGDVKTLMDNVADLESKLANKTRNEMLQMRKNGNCDEDFVAFLENLLKKKDTEISKLKEDLRKTRMHLMAESRKVSEVDRDVYKAKSERDKLISQCMKQKIEITRLKLKCNEEVQGKRKVRPGKVEKIPLGENEAQNPPNIVENKENENIIANATPIINTTECNNEVKTSTPKNANSTMDKLSSKSNAPSNIDGKCKKNKILEYKDLPDCPSDCNQQ